MPSTYTPGRCAGESTPSNPRSAPRQNHRHAGGPKERGGALDQAAPAGRRRSRCAVCRRTLRGTRSSTLDAEYSAEPGARRPGLDCHVRGYDSSARLRFRASGRSSGTAGQSAFTDSSPCIQHPEGASVGGNTRCVAAIAQFTVGLGVIIYVASRGPPGAHAAASHGSATARSRARPRRPRRLLPQWE